MARGKHSSLHYTQKRSERLQNAMIEKIEAQVRSQTLARDIKRMSQCQPLPLQKQYDNSITLPNHVSYAGVNLVPKFSVAELAENMKLSSFIDMSADLDADVDMKDMINRFCTNCEATEGTEFRIYMRNAKNFYRFATLQNTIETMMSIDKQDDLQGWILHFGTMFVFGGVRFTLEESIERVHEGIKELFAQQMIEAVNQNLNALQVS